MKRALCACVLVVAAASGGCARGSTGTARAGEMSIAVLTPYLRIHAALAQDSLDRVTANAGSVATAAAALGASAVRIDTAAVQLTSATDLADARAKFGGLSEAIEAYMAAAHLAPPSNVRKAFCPMVLKPWWQEGSTLANPYFGKEMPTCGEFK